MAFVGIVVTYIVALFTITLLGDTFPMVSQATQTKIVCKSYIPWKLMYQPTTLGFTKLLVFHLLGSCLGFLYLYALCYKGFLAYF
jgi:hypothetical protein